MLSRPNYSRFRDPADIDDWDFSGCEVTVEVEDAPLRIGRDGPVLAYISGKVEMIGREAEGYSVGDVWWFDADGVRHPVADLGTGGWDASIT